MDWKRIRTADGSYIFFSPSAGVTSKVRVCSTAVASSCRLSAHALRQQKRDASPVRINGIVALAVGDTAAVHTWLLSYGTVSQTPSGPAGGLG